MHSLFLFCLGIHTYRPLQLLIAISCALPFLAIRLLYSILGAFDGPTSQFNLITGKVGPYVGMEVIMECIAVVIYITAGLLLPLSTKDLIEEEEMNGRRQGAGSRYV